MSNWQVVCADCGAYGHEIPMGPQDKMIRKDPESGSYLCFECYKKRNGQ